MAESASFPSAKALTSAATVVAASNKSPATASASAFARRAQLRKKCPSVESIRDKGSQWSWSAFKVRTKTERRREAGLLESACVDALNGTSTSNLFFEDDAVRTEAGKHTRMLHQAALAVHAVQKRWPTWDIIGLGGLPLTWAESNSCRF